MDFVQLRGKYMAKGPFSFGKSSRRRLLTLDPALQRLLEEAIKHVDFSIICGHRGRADQERAFLEGKTEVHFPHSKHNSFPSKAVDVAPWPIEWQDHEGFTLLAGILYGIAKMQGIEIRLGIDWDGDGYVEEHNFKDRPHIELLY
jgi:peptidoglycan L-alanyl-D-glutamate endopeptidase CwlK